MTKKQTGGSSRRKYKINVYGIDEKTIAKVNSFKCLGAIKANTGRCSEDIKAIIQRVNTVNWMQYGKIEEFDITQYAHMACDLHTEQKVAL